MTQVAGPLWLAIDQLIPVPPGSGSVSVVPVESPGPALLSVIVKPIGEPAFTETASATFLMVSVGQLTVVEALALPLPSLPLTKLAGPLWLAIDQLIPLPPGSGSVSVVPVESPGPALLSVIVKPIGEPAFTVAASAALVMVSVGQFTVSLAEALPLPSLVVVTLAVLL